LCIAVHLGTALTHCYRRGWFAAGLTCDSRLARNSAEGFLAGAAALLFPIDWPEPFGLVMIEAMAYGTPVIAYRQGSVPEVIDEGVTGFVVDNEEEAVRALGRLGEIDRRQVRACFERRFTARRMASEYVALYEELVRGHARHKRQ
jgi:glycosyltransferase involved in cell wall biosynthesis